MSAGCVMVSEEDRKTGAVGVVAALVTSFVVCGALLALRKPQGHVESVAHVSDVFEVGSAQRPAFGITWDGATTTTVEPIPLQEAAWPDVPSDAKVCAAWRKASPARRREVSMATDVPVEAIERACRFIEINP